MSLTADTATAVCVCTSRGRENGAANMAQGLVGTIGMFTLILTVLIATITQVRERASKHVVLVLEQ